MPLPAQFQLGLELTNIVNPLSQAIGALGSLALVSAIQKAWIRRYNGDQISFSDWKTPYRRSHQVPLSSNGRESRLNGHIEVH